MPLPLWLHLSLCGLQPSASTTREVARHPRPGTAPLIWLRLSQRCAPQSARLLIQRLADLEGRELVLSGPPELLSALDLPAALSERLAPLPEPPDTPANARILLDAWKPDLLILAGFELPPALIVAAQARALPILLVDAGSEPAPAHAATLLRRIHTVLTRDESCTRRLVRLGAIPNRIISCGALTEPPIIPGCIEAERAALVAGLRARPVWLATAVPDAELDCVLTAHAHALRHAHRLLLILAPDDPDSAPELARQLAAQNWNVGRRTLEGEPEEEMQIFLADDPCDYGLWYRLAPVCYMGGTLSGRARSARSPMEPAALGSAILHGPRTDPFSDQYQQLDRSRATRRVILPDALGEALADLIAPHRAAALARNGWAVSSAGAGAVETVVEAIETALPRPAPEAA